MKSLGSGVQPLKSMGSGVQPLKSMGSGVQPLKSLESGVQPLKSMRSGAEPLKCKHLPRGNIAEWGVFNGRNLGREGPWSLDPPNAKGQHLKLTTPNDTQTDGAKSASQSRLFFGHRRGYVIWVKMWVYGGRVWQGTAGYMARHGVFYSDGGSIGIGRHNDAVVVQRLLWNVICVAGISRSPQHAFDHCFFQRKKPCDASLNVVVT